MSLIDSKDNKSAAEREEAMRVQVEDLIALFGDGFTREYLTFVVKKF